MKNTVTAYQDVCLMPKCYSDKWDETCNDITPQNVWADEWNLISELSSNGELLTLDEALEDEACQKCGVEDIEPYVSLDRSNIYVLYRADWGPFGDIAYIGIKEVQVPADFWKTRKAHNPLCGLETDL